MKVLLTGGAGFIGSHTAEYALKVGLEVVIVDRLDSEGEVLTNPRCKIYKTDLESRELRDIFEEEAPDYCIHLAEQTDVDESLLYKGLNPNLRGLIHLLDMCREFPVRKFVYGSSADVYGATELLPVDETFRCTPLTASGRAKLSAEEYIKQYGALYGLRYSLLRYTNVYGLRQKSGGSGEVIYDTVDAYVNGERPVLYGKGLQTRDFVYVTDVAAANIQALSLDGGETYNIGSGKSIRIVDLVDMLNEMLDQKAVPKFMPARPEDFVHLCVSNKKAEEQFGWRPRIKLQEGLTQIVGDYMYRRFMDALHNGITGSDARPHAHDLVKETAS